METTGEESTCDCFLFRFVSLVTLYFIDAVHCHGDKSRWPLPLPKATPFPPLGVLIIAANNTMNGIVVDHRWLFTWRDYLAASSCLSCIIHHHDCIQRHQSIDNHVPQQLRYSHKLWLLIQGLSLQCAMSFKKI